MIIILNIVIVTSWRIHGHCFLIDIEEYLENKKLKQNNTKKQLNNPHKVGTFSQTILNEFPFIKPTNLKLVFSFIPLMSTIICLSKII
jgi:hypothetical protein